MDLETLGAFYLGKEREGDELTDRLVMYDARDLTTHAVCIGMTGSGKTGLCVGLLEEAALDRVPALIIDPKGDMTNLLLGFPELRGQDFRPWVDADAARRAGVEADEWADMQADMWRNGLAGWGQTGDRIRRLRETTDFVVYTPGSDAGIPVSMLSSFASPDLDWEDDAESIRERIGGTVSGLLGLVGVDADPVQSREHILLSTLFEHFWRAGRDLDIATLIMSIQEPPVRQLGVFDVDTFFPVKDRSALAMKLNNLIASPGFRSWLEGQPLDIPRFLSAPDGRNRHSIFYIAHLSEAERMFFVTLLLNQLISWMRSQPGTPSLRALLYMDEIFGYLPPVAEPPSKKPFLTMLKQARAYGIGTVLCTQNPADIDYKALTNAGTWFLGRLQADRDKQRVLDGLVAAATEAGGAMNRGEIDDLITGLDKRVFLLHNVHEEAPITFNTRWVMSYLAGPLTRPQVSELMGDRAPDPETVVAPPPSAPGPAARSPSPTSRSAAGLAGAPPMIAGDVPQLFLPVETAEPPTSGNASLAYSAGLVGVGTVHYLHRKSGAETDQPFVLLARPDAGGRIDWSEARELPDLPDGDDPDPAAGFEPLPASLNDAKEISAAQKKLADRLYRTRRLTLWHSPDLSAFSTPGETAEEFRLRLTHEARERRDDEVDDLEERYAKKLAQVEERVRRAQARLAKKEADASARTREAIVSVGETLVGALLGRRSSRAASSSLSKYRMRSSARLGVEQAEEDVETLQEELAELERELEAETGEIIASWESSALDLEEVAVAPRRTDVQVDRVALAWVPTWRAGG